MLGTCFEFKVPDSFRQTRKENKQNFKTLHEKSFVCRRHTFYFKNKNADHYRT